jgi:hypothetical protein
MEATLDKQIEELRASGLPGAIQLIPGMLTSCNDMEDLLRELVLLAKMADSDCESLSALIEAPVPSRSPPSELQAANRELGQAARSDERSMPQCPKNSLISA